MFHKVKLTFRLDEDLSARMLLNLFLQEDHLEDLLLLADVVSQLVLMLQRTKLDHITKHLHN
jgi:hypothetical protein